ncbi:FAD:protein FMN transferase [Catellatospora citrea]|uniref:FAD:protein FMN transferase n=1 Tax=Catellatospora citrea TaxID=53366 RepID=A0A8J3KIT9_9ACTN|nr:FAD:protein FMN transferase [Catellatospora citrea]RKE02805.1 thiamine biosynthesis lipoprotein [Catellatospora citrea]GIG01640.1 FAD:protein FMN transferase [Catellatospora citrea]
MNTLAPPRRAWVEQIMGMPVSLHLRGPGLDSAPVERTVDAVFALLREADAVFSTYRADSAVSRINRGELTVAAAHPWVAEVAQLCDDARERTGGWFDARLPGPGGERTWDPSGLVKGWAVARAARLLSGADCCLNAGGDVIVSTAAGHPPWRVGVEDPLRPSRLAEVVTLASGAVATSGTARRGAHIVDPYRGSPTAEVAGVTVIGPSLLWADVFATAAAARGVTGLDLLTGTGYRGLLIGRDGHTRVTPDWFCS